MNSCASATSVENRTLEEICGGTLPTGFDSDIWNVGSVGSLTVTEGRFGRKAYTYPSLKNVGTAETENAKYYNFSTDDTLDWQEYTVISTPDEFKAIGEDSTKWNKNYVLGADIDLDGAEITPIGKVEPDFISFTGKFSGNGHTVSNFKINKPDSDYVGLFGFNEGLIMDLGVENAEVTENRYVSGICGNNQGTITNCHNAATVNGDIDIGGVCGSKESGGIITNCYYNKDFCTVGGIEKSDIDGSATGLTTDELCGELPTGFDSSVWTEGKLNAVTDSQNSKFRTAKFTLPSLKGVGKTYSFSEEKQYNFSIDGENDCWQEYTLISSADEFKALTKDSSRWDKNYVLCADIDLGGATIEPIGNDKTNFTGKFSGDRHIVSNFKINKPKDDNVGLFNLRAGLVMNLGVDNAEVTGNNDVGGICGVNSSGTIINCYYAGTVRWYMRNEQRNYCQLLQHRFN